MPSCGFCGESFDNFSQLYQHSPNCPNSSKPDTWLSRFTEQKEEKEEAENPRYKLISELYDNIIEIGAYTTPAGHNHYNPTLIERSVFCKTKENKTLFPIHAIRYQKQNPEIKIQNIINEKDGFFEHTNILKEYLDWIQLELRNDWDEQSKILFIIPNYWSFENTVKFLCFLFETYKFGAISLMLTSQAANKFVNANENLLVDIGHSRISSCFQGRDTLIPKSSIILPFGGKIILDQLNSMLSLDNYQDKISYYMNFDDNEFIFEILVDNIDNTLHS